MQTTIPNSLPITAEKTIENKIYTIRGAQVMLDEELAVFS
jgi:hypothetical protein